jgi:NAD(P)-dependent dehydrogenase (short-subunit alcohol dehydrogenase family)
LHKAYKVDVSDISQIVDVVENISIDFGHIDILVNNAGIFFRRDLTNMSFQDWDLMMIVNARSVFYFSQAAAKCFIRQKTGGKIINVSSISGEIVQSAGKTHYASAKAAVIHLSKCIALELAPYRISVNVLSPGPTETPQIAPYDPKDYLERHYIPLGRMALPEDQANGALFFASDLATHITGQVLHIDGGEVMSRIHPLSYQ